MRKMTFPRRFTSIRCFERSATTVIQVWLRRRPRSRIQPVPDLPVYGIGTRPYLPFRVTEMTQAKVGEPSCKDPARITPTWRPPPGREVIGKLWLIRTMSDGLGRVRADTAAVGRIRTGSGGGGAPRRELRSIVSVAIPRPEPADGVRWTTPPTRAATIVAIRMGTARRPRKAGKRITTFLSEVDCLP